MPEKQTPRKRKAIWVDAEVHDALRVVAFNRGEEMGVIANRAILAWAMQEERKLSAKRAALQLASNR